MVWVEAELVVNRRNGEMASEMTLLQLAVSSVLSKKAGQEFRKAIQGLTEE